MEYQEISMEADCFSVFTHIMSAAFVSNFRTSVQVYLDIPPFFLLLIYISCFMMDLFYIIKGRFFK